MEQNLRQKVDSFRYLYKEHQKEIGATIHRRDKEMEASMNYREKLWTESLDLCNSNLSNMYHAQGELENTLNSIGRRQNKVIRSNAIMLEWATNQLLGDKIDEKPQASIFDFAPSQAGYHIELVNLKPSKSHQNKKK